MRFRRHLPLAKMIFVAESLEQYRAWVQAIGSTVVQTARIDNVYHFNEILGKGAFGSVILGVAKDSRHALTSEEIEASDGRNCDPSSLEKVAIKIIRKSQIIKGTNGISSLLNEFRMHWALDKCENILRLLQIFEDQSNVYLVLEYQPKGTLITLIKENMLISEETARMIME